MWFDHEGIFYSVTKSNSKLDKTGLELTFNYIRSKAGDKKICWLGDVTNTSAPDKEAKDFAAIASPGIIKVLALITNSSLSIIVSEIFFLVKPPPFPVKMFTNVAEAKAWLRKHLAN